MDWRLPGGWRGCLSSRAYRLHCQASTSASCGVAERRAQPGPAGRHAGRRTGCKPGPCAPGHRRQQPRTQRRPVLPVVAALQMSLSIWGELKQRVVNLSQRVSLHGPQELGWQGPIEQRMVPRIKSESSHLIPIIRKKQVGHARPQRGGKIKGGPGRAEVGKWKTMLPCESTRQAGWWKRVQGLQTGQAGTAGRAPGGSHLAASIGTSGGRMACCWWAIWWGILTGHRRSSGTMGSAVGSASSRSGS